MTEGRSEGSAEPHPPGSRWAVLGWRARLAARQRALLRRPAVVAALRVQRAYDQGGGEMLAGGLAFFAFFTVVPTLLLFTSGLGLLIADPDLRGGLVEVLVEQVEPLRDVARAIVDGLADSAPTGTVIGILGLIWGASGFYGALMGAMERIFPGPKSRDFLRTRIFGVISVALVLTGLSFAVVATIAVPVITEGLGVDLGLVSTLLAPILACAVATVVCLAIYVAVPPDGATPRQAARPALLAGIAIGLLTSLFGALAPFLVRSFLALGVVGSVFVALVWFHLLFRIMLYGAALARLARDRERVRAGPPSI